MKKNIGQVQPDKQEGLIQNNAPLIRATPTFPLMGKMSSSPLRERKPVGQVRGYAGFTLMEVLIVVLIIGILAAIAVPQYQKAVEKARATEAFILIKQIKQARDAYRLLNPDVESPALDELDIEIPGTEVDCLVTTTPHPFHQTKYFQVGMLSSGHPHAFRVDNGKLLYTLAYYDAFDAWFCHVENGGDTKYIPLCKSLGGAASSVCNNKEEGTCFQLH